MISNARWTQPIGNALKRATGVSRGKLHSAFPRRSALRTMAAASVCAIALAGCQVSELAYEGAHLAPVPASLDNKIQRMGMSERSPILLRIYKKENTLEVWKEDKSRRYQLLKSYEICAWSGELGPKLKEGDRQAPEGFYAVSPAQMNPNSSYHLSFNIGFPNAFDRSLGRTGSHLMVHGDCSSRGCYAMEDQPIQEIYALAREAFRGGQRAFQVQAYPFRMTPENMAKHAGNKNIEFWEMLKEGSDHFEVTRQPPKVSVCRGRYVFNASATNGQFSSSAECPEFDVRDDVEQLVATKEASDLEKREKLVARAQAQQDREERWQEREEAIASFFAKERANAPSVAAVDDVAAVAVAPAAAAASGIPIPRRSPVRRSSVVASTSGGGGFRLPNPFKRNKEPVASTAAVASAPPASPTPTTQPQPTTVASSTTPTASNPEQAATPVEPLAFAPQEEEGGGFFSGVARGGKGLWKRAGSIFN